MATHDYVINNASGAAVRGDLNNALAAIASNNSSSTEPGTTYAYQFWADTSNNLLKIRDGSNNAWVTLRELDGTMLLEDGSASTPGLAFTDDVNTGLFSPAADKLAISTAGTQRLVVDDSGYVGINVTAPTSTLHIDGQFDFQKEGAAAFAIGTTSVGSSLGSQLVLRKSRGTLGSPTTVVADDELGKIVFQGYTEDGTYRTGYQIKAIASPQDTGDSDIENKLSIVNGGSERLRLGDSGAFFCSGIYSNTTSSGANVHVTSGGHVTRSTSSIKYKTNVETLEDSYADALLDCRPVWYRSLCSGDNPDYSWWGFIAEEVAAIDPRLVQYKTVEVTYGDNEEAIETPCTPEPEGVMYERFVPHLLNLIKRQKAAIEALEARVTTLEAP